MRVRVSVATVLLATLLVAAVSTSSAVTQSSPPARIHLSPTPDAVRPPAARASSTYSSHLLSPTECNPQPNASFTVSPMSGIAPLEVTLIDTSTCSGCILGEREWKLGGADGSWLCYPHQCPGKLTITLGQYDGPITLLREWKCPPGTGGGGWEYVTSPNLAIYNPVRFQQSVYTVDENENYAYITVLYAAPCLPQCDNYDTFEFSTESGGTATPGQDYVPISTTQDIQIWGEPGWIELAVPLLHGGGPGEGSETVNLVLRNPTGMVQIVEPSTAKLIIVDGPDLGLERFNVPAGALAFSAGRYFVPIEAKIHYWAGSDPVNDVLVRFSDDSGWHTTYTIDQLLPGESKTVHVDWDLTSALTAGNGIVNNAQVTVIVDSDGTIDEGTYENNVMQEYMSVDVRPRITDLKTGYRPATFLAGPALPNNIDVWVDWNGAQEGTGAPGESGRVVYTLNGSPSAVTVGDPAAAPAASHTYDMGNDLQPGDNTLQVQAINAAGFSSDPRVITLHQADNAAWLAAATVEVEAEPPTAPYDKIAVYQFQFEWPDEVLQGFFDVPAEKARFLRSSYGPSLDSWSLGAEYRTDGVGTIEGGGSMEGEVRGMKVLSAGGAVSVEAKGSVGLGQDNRLTLKELEGKVRAEGYVNTPQVPLTPYLPFIRVQGKVGAGVDATMGVEEQPDGSLDWKPFILGLDATAEGIASAGAEGLAYAEGALGGQPRGEFQLPADPSLLKSLSIDLYARAKAQVLVWEKSWEAHFIYNAIGASGVAGADTLTLTSPVVVSEQRLSDRVAGSALALQASGLPDLSYPYAAPDLARHADGTMTLVYVYDDPARPDGQQLEIAASRWDGSTWSTPVTLTNDALLDVYPSVAYDSAGQAVALWTRLENLLSDPANTDPQDILGDMEIAYAVYSPTLGVWTMPFTLTDNAQMDFVPQVRADDSGNVMALWLRDTDNAFPLYPDDVTHTLGSDVYYALWDGGAWSTPTVAITEVNTTEAPQFARRGNQALLTWSHDADGDATTITDTAVYLAAWDGSDWSAGAAFSGVGDDIADLWPRLAYDTAGRANLVWVRQRVPLSAELDDVVDRLYFARRESGTWTTPTLAVEALSIVEPLLLAGPDGELVVLWQARSAGGMDLWYAVYDPTAGQWSLPIQFTDDSSLEWAYTGYVGDGGELHVLFLNRDVVSDTVPPGTRALVAAAQEIVIPAFGDSNLEDDSRTLGLDLTVDSLILSKPNPAPGEAITLTATVRNSGDYAVSPVRVAFYDDVTQIGSVQTLPDLTAGYTATAQVTWTVSTPAAVHTLKARVDPNGEVAETDETNNEATLTTVLPDLVVDWAYTDARYVIGENNSITVTARVRNAGTGTTQRSFSVSLRADDPLTGTEVLSTMVGSGLSPGAVETMTLILYDPASVLGGTHVGWVVVDTQNSITEADEGNNAAVTALNVLPDLTLSAEDVSGSGPLDITLHNNGLITATGVPLTVRSGSMTGTLLYSGTLPTVSPGESASINATILPGTYTLFVQADPADVIAELDECNNLAVRAVEVEAWLYLPLVLRGE